MEKISISESITSDDFVDIKEITDFQEEILYISINQTQTFIAMGTKTGFKLFIISPPQLFYESKCGPIKIVEMLNTTNLVLLVGQNEIGDFSPRKGTIYQIKDNTVICSFWPFSNPITLAKLNKQRIILLENTTIHIFSTNDMKALHSLDIGINNINNSIIYNNNVNYKNKICLSSSSDKNNFLIYSSNESEGIIKVYDLLYLTYKTTIQAHKGPIEQMNINSNGDLLVTSSIKGTTIRVFSLPKGDKLYNFRRGIASATIFSINFDIETNSKIVLLSNTGTIHIFNLGKRENFDNNNRKKSSDFYMNDEKNNNKGIFGYVTDFVKKSNFISKDYEDLYNYERPIISGNFSDIKTKNIICFNGKNTNEIITVNENGIYHSFSVNYKKNSISKITKETLDELKLIV
jgi:autophagy-related protein 18